VKVVKVAVRVVKVAMFRKMAIPYRPTKATPLCSSGWMKACKKLKRWLQ
jgi:hypothetical protein